MNESTPDESAAEPTVTNGKRRWKVHELLNDRRIVRSLTMLSRHYCGNPSVVAERAVFAPQNTSGQLVWRQRPGARAEKKREQSRHLGRAIVYRCRREKQNSRVARQLRQLMV